MIRPAWVVIAFVMAAAPVTAQTGSWPMFHYDSTNAGYSTAISPERGCIQWCLPMSISLFSSPTIVDGRVYFPSIVPEGFLCLDAETGDWLWEFPTGPIPIAAPAVIDGKVYIGTYYGDVVCLDAETGELVWAYTDGSDAFSSATVAYDPNILEYMVYIGTSGGDLLCLGANNGWYAWQFSTGGPVYSTPAVVDTSVYFGSYDGNVYCLSTTDWMTPEWTFATGGGVFTSPAATDTAIYVGSFDGSVYCLDPESGGLIWQYATGDSIWSSPAVAYGMVYIGSGNGYVFGLDAANPDPPVWVYQVYPMGTEVYSSPAVADSMVWVGSNGGGIHCLDALSGDLVWADMLDGFIGSSPAIIDSLVYLSSLQSFYALGTSSNAYNTHDIAISGILPSRTVICQGDSITVDVEIQNNSWPCSSPVPVNCVLYYENLTMPSPEDIETYRGMGDINGDGYIDSVDSCMMGYSWQTTPGHCNWNPYADLNGDQVVDVTDVFLLSMYYPSDMWTFFGVIGQLPIAHKHVLEMEPWSTEHVVFECKTASMSLGAHSISAYVSYAPNEVNPWDNQGPNIPVSIVSSFTLNVTATEGQTTVPPPGSYVCPCNTDTTFEATPDFWFHYWTLDGDSVGTTNPYSIFMGDAHDLHAVFKSTCDDEPSTPALTYFRNYPNPFNPATIIVFYLPADLHVSIEIFDTSGRRVRMLADGKMKGGVNEVVWDGRNGDRGVVASGVYYCRLEAGGIVQTKKMVLLR